MKKRHNMQGVKVTKNVKITLTAADWKMASSSTEELIAVNINQRIEDAFRDGLSRATAASIALEIMKFFAGCGAYGAEQKAVLVKVLNEIYGE